MKNRTKITKNKIEGNIFSIVRCKQYVFFNTEHNTSNLDNLNKFSTYAIWRVACAIHNGTFKKYCLVRDMHDFIIFLKLWL